MDVSPSGSESQSTPQPPQATPQENVHASTRMPAIIVGVVAAVIVALSAYYLLRPEPLLVQGEVDATPRASTVASRTSRSNADRT